MNQKCSIQEKVYHILPEMSLKKKVFPAIYFPSENFQEERVWLGPSMINFISKDQMHQLCKTCEYQWHKWDDNLIENNNGKCFNHPKII